jgi:EAL domain-containing protein (putative c-di-GMP-specific phosphodiesterase class I)
LKPEIAGLEEAKTVVGRPFALIVDDEPAIARMVADIADDCGFEAHTIHDFGLWDSMQRQCRVVVLDLLMPGFDGVEVIRSLAASGRAENIILMSGLDRRTLDSVRKIASMHKLSVAGLLQKPFRPAELSVMLSALLEAPTLTVTAGPPRSAIAVTLEDIQRGIDQDEFVLHYQPQIAVADGRLIGVEALVRWQHPQHGLLFPDAFVHVVESSELALPFTYEVLRKVVSDWPLLAAQLDPHGTAAVNFPPIAMSRIDVPERVQALLAGSGLEPSRLTIEVTETSIQEDASMFLDIQTRLRMRGFHLSIDDFGTGHAGLERLHGTAFDELKIDMMFVRGADHDPSLRAIAESANSLGHSLGMKVVAEGVETADSLQWLARIGCDAAQGYHIGRPMPAQDLRRWVASRAP